MHQGRSAPISLVEQCSDAFGHVDQGKPSAAGSEPLDQEQQRGDLVGGASRDVQESQ